MEQTKINRGRQFSFVVVAMGLLLVVGCKSHRQATNTSPTDTTQPTSCVPLNYEFETITRNFTANIQSMGITVNGQLRIKNDSTIWITISKLMEIARIKLTNDSVFVHIKFQNRYYQGTYSEIAQKLGVQLNYDIAQSLLMGNTIEEHLSDISNKDWIFSALKACTTKKIEERNITHGYRKGEWTGKYSNFEGEEGKMLAKTIEILCNTKINKERLLIVFGKTEVNPAAITFPFAVPANAKPL